jgi:hypothetical protein
MREGPEFVFWFMGWGLVVVAVVVAISVALFWVLKRWSDGKAKEADRRIRTRSS